MNNSVKNANIFGVSAWSITICFMLAAVAIVLPGIAAADYTGYTGSSSVSKVICGVVKQLQGPVARGIAAFGIIFLGFSLFLGKISWGTAIALGIGLGAIFGANKIVDMMTTTGGGGGTGCST